MTAKGNRTDTQPPMKHGSPNDFQTPPQALAPLLPYLKPGWTIWEPASGTGNLVKELGRAGHPVIGTDILTGHDFLTWRPEASWDCIITNPPYSLKQDFLVRCYELERPFALLLPLTTFETRKRQALFEKHGVQVIFFDKRINFETPDGEGGGAWFMTAWFTWGLNLPRTLNFVRLLPRSQTTLEVDL